MNKKKDNWISVKDRKPEEEQDVIIQSENFIGEGWFGVHGWCCKKGGKEKYMNEVVTHWMPKPQK